MAIHQLINDQYSSSAEMPCSEENIGLAMVLDAETKDEMPLLLTAVALKSSPMFRAVVESYGEDANAIAALQLEITSDEEFYQASDDSYPIRELCARMFLAGRLAERHAQVAMNGKKEGPIARIQTAKMLLCALVKVLL